VGPTPAPDLDPVGPAEPMLVTRLRGVPAARRDDIVVAFLRTEVARIFGVQRPESLDVDRGLFDMGMDSLTSLELKGRIESAVGTSLPSTLVFNHPTVQALAAHLLDEVLVGVEPPAAGSPAGVPVDRGSRADDGPGGSPHPVSLDQAASPVRQLTDDQALAALLEGPDA